MAHLLLAPVERNLVLRRPAVGRMRSTAAFTAAVGAAVGSVASHRLPGTAPQWIASGARAGLTTGATAAGAAMTMSGARIRHAAATALGLFILAWSVADLVFGLRASPLTLVAELALWPLGAPVLPAGGMVVVASLVAAVGVVRAGGMSLEAAERRSSLVGQRRFAATVRDLRTVVLLRRQLAQERPRRRPWVRLPAGSRARGGVWKREWQGLLRWPPGRVLRSVGPAAGAGLALRGMWSGTTALVVVAGVALWLVAIDAVEGLAQEQDHPDSARGLPVPDGSRLIRHLPAAVAAVLVLAVPAALPSGGRAGLVLPLWAATALPAAMCAEAGAAISTARGGADPSAVMMALAPEIAGFRMVIREALPPALVIAGLLPLVASRQAAGAGRGPVATFASEVTLVVPLAAVVWWLTRRRLARAPLCGSGSSPSSTTTSGPSTGCRSRSTRVSTWFWWAPTARARPP